MLFRSGDSGLVLSEEGNPAGLSSCSGGLRSIVELCVHPWQGPLSGHPTGLAPGPARKESPGGDVAAPAFPSQPPLAGSCSQGGPRAPLQELLPSWHQALHHPRRECPGSAFIHLIISLMTSSDLYSASITWLGTTGLFTCHVSPLSSCWHGRDSC